MKSESKGMQFLKNYNIEAGEVSVSWYTAAGIILIQFSGGNEKKFIKNIKKNVLQTSTWKGPQHQPSGQGKSNHNETLVYPQ